MLHTDKIALFEKRELTLVTHDDLNVIRLALEEYQVQLQIKSMTEYPSLQLQESQSATERMMDLFCTDHGILVAPFSPLYDSQDHHFKTSREKTNQQIHIHL
jgi:hypothetical protein